MHLVAAGSLASLPGRVDCGCLTLPSRRYPEFPRNFPDALEFARAGPFDVEASASSTPPASPGSTGARRCCACSPTSA